MYLPSRDSHRGEGLGRPGAQLRSRREGKGQGGPPLPAEENSLLTPPHPIRHSLSAPGGQ